MKKQQRRFEEAFKKLQIEVQNKTKRCIDNKMLSAQFFSPVKGPLDIPDPKNIDAGGYGPRKYDNNAVKTIRNSFVKIHQPDPRVAPPSKRKAQRYQSTDTIALAKMKNINVQSATNSAAPLPWDSREFFDFSQFEKALVKSTNRLHSLVDPISLFQSNQHEEFIPLDYFDCLLNMSESEKRLRENGEPADGEALLVDINGNMCWTPVTITSYDNDKCMFYVETKDEKPMVRHLSRFNIHFDDDNFLDLHERERISRETRREYEKVLTTDCFLDSIPDPPYLIDFISPKLERNLTEDARHEIAHVQKMLILRGLVQLHQNEDLAQELADLGGDINLYSATPLKEPFTAETKFKPSLDIIQNSNALAENPAYVTAVQILHKAIYNKKEELKNFIQTFFKDQQKTVDEWKEKLTEYKESINKSLTSFIDGISADLLENFGPLLDYCEIEKLQNIHSDHPPLQFFEENDCQFNRFRKYLFLVLSVFSREIVEFNMNFFIDLISYPFNFTEPEEITVDGFTTITQSVCDKSISRRKPFLIIELTTEKQTISELISDFQHSLPDAITDMYNPLRLMFDRTNIAGIEQLERPKFESFCFEYEVTKSIPPKKLYEIKNEDIINLTESAATVFGRRLSNELNKIYTSVPKLQVYEDKVMKHFTGLPIPKLEDTYAFIEQLEKDKDVFNMNFPIQVWLSFCRLVFEKTHQKVNDLVFDQREKICILIQIDMDDKIDSIHNRYKDLTAKLKRFVSSAPQWCELKETCFTSFDVRKQLEQETDEVNSVSNLLFSLNYGHDYEDLNKEINLITWPILTDMELGKALALLKQKKDQYQNTLVQNVQQIEEEIVARKEKIENTNNDYERQQNRDYVEHMEKKLETMKALLVNFEDCDFDVFRNPRIRLWTIVKISQDQIEEWGKTIITKMDFNATSEICTEWLKNLRVLTSGFRKDKRSLRLLIQTKNDIENMIPIFKACAQSLSPKLLQNHRKDIEDLIGDPKFDQKTIDELIKLKIAEKLDSIAKLYKQAKLEDKADYEIVAAQTLIKTAAFTLSPQNVFLNTTEMLKDFRDRKTAMIIIESTEGIEENKKRMSQSIIKKLVQFTTIVELLATIQELVANLAPIKNVQGITVDFSGFTDASNSFDMIINQVKKEKLILPFSEKEDNIKILRDIRAKLKVAQEQFISVLASFREKIPRLLLVSDSQIISVFTDDNERKLNVIPTIFPGVESVVRNDQNEIISLNLRLGDELVFNERVKITTDLLTMIPKLEEMIAESMKTAFFDFYEDRVSDISKVPTQLIVLRMLSDPNYEPSTHTMEFEKRKIIEALKTSIRESKMCPHVRINTEKKEAYIVNDQKSIQYEFQISDCNSLWFTATSLEILADLLSNASITSPTLISSEIYSSSSLICQQFGYICGKYCSIIHATQTTTINRLSTIIQELDTIKVWVCLTDTELLLDKQMYELAMLVKIPYFLTVTTQMIMPVLSVGKGLFTISSDAFKQHVLDVGLLAYEYQPDAVKFAATTLSNYVHPYSILKFIEDEVHEEKVAFDLNFLSGFSSLLPENVFEKVKDMVDDSFDPDDKFYVQVVKSLISTTDFLKGVHKIMSSLLSGKQMILVSGQQFSGTSTCVKAAAQSLGMKYTAVAFATSNWIKYLNLTLANVDDTKTVFHVMTQFDISFLAHVSALAFGSSLCEGEQSLLKIPKNTVLIFEVMTPMTNPELIAIPIIAFDSPLVKSGDLLNYWLANISIQLEQDTIDFIKESVNNLITSNLQISLFFQLFRAFITKLPPQKQGSLSLLIAYCTFWSNTVNLSTREKWEEYSKFVTSKAPNVGTTSAFFELTLQSNEQFLLRSAYSSNNTYQFDSALHTKFNKWLCGPISDTIIPTPQFIHGVEIIPMLINAGNSCAIIGEEGCGKTTLANYLANQCFLKPDYEVLRIDGINTTPEILLKSIMSVCNTTVEGIVEPKTSKNILVIVDPLRTDGDMYGALISIIKTGNAIINNNVFSFARIKFLLVIEKATYQIITCCFPYTMQPYTDEDYTFIANEVITRILVSLNTQNQIISQITQNVTKTMPQIIQCLRQVKNAPVRTFFKVMRSIEYLDVPRNILNVSDYLLMKMLEYNPKIEIKGVSPQNRKFCYDIVFSISNGTKSFKYVQMEDSVTFERSLLQTLSLFSHRLPVTTEMLNFCEFLLNVHFQPYCNAVVVNDLNLDYEVVTKFISFSVAAKFVVYNSPQQIPGLIHDSIMQSQQTFVYVRRPEPTILHILANGIKSNQQQMLSLIQSDDGFIAESGVGNMFPYSHFSRPAPNSKNAKDEPRQDLFGFFAFHAFYNAHFIFSVSALSEIEECYRSKFEIWDKNDEVLDTDNPRMNFLFHAVSPYSSKSFVPAIAQLPTVSHMFEFLESKLKTFVEQRHTFLLEVLTVIDSIENALKDCDARAEGLREQIRIDESMKGSAESAVRNALDVVANFTGDLAKAQSEYETICENNQKLIEYMEKDGQKTLEEYKVAQKRAQRAFTADQQYKLFSQQRPNEDILNVFAAFCVLIGLTPREGNDYWPEARGILRTGRMAQQIQIFDPSDIPDPNLEKFDVAMRNVDENKFNPVSPCYSMALWLKAIHKHSKRTSFNPCVNPKMSEMMILKSRKEEEIAKIKERLAKAQNDADQLKKALNDLVQKIQTEKSLLENIILFSSISKNIVKVFPSLRIELQNFSDGERKFSKNTDGFLLKSSYDTVVRPLFDPETCATVDSDVQEVFSANFIDDDFFVSVKSLMGTDDPLVLRLLSGDRVITVFDPYNVAATLTGFLPDTSPHQVISHMNFVYADNTKPVEEMCSKIVEAAESGKVLVVSHADDLVSSPFFCAVSNASTTNTFFNSVNVSIDPDFRAVLIVDSPPKWMPPHMSFIAELSLDTSFIHAALANDNSLLTVAQKVKNAELSELQQKETLFFSLQALHPQLRDLHSTKAELLKDTGLQASLLMNAESALEDAAVTEQHALDNNPWIRSVTPTIMKFCGKLQSLCKMSPLYLWPFQKIDDILRHYSQFKKSDNENDVYQFLYSRIAATMLKRHRSTVEDLKNVSPVALDEILREAELNNKSLFVVHSEELSVAAKFFTSLNIPERANFFISETTNIDAAIKSLEALIDENREPFIVISFFGGTPQQIAKLTSFLIRKKSDTIYKLMSPRKQVSIEEQVENQQTSITDENVHPIKEPPPRIQTDVSGEQQPTPSPRTIPQTNKQKNTEEQKEVEEKTEQNEAPKEAETKDEQDGNDPVQENESNEERNEKMRTKFFIHTNTFFDLSPMLVNAAVVIALE